MKKFITSIILVSGLIFFPHVSNAGLQDPDWPDVIICEIGTGREATMWAGDTNYDDGSSNRRVYGGPIGGGTSVVRYYWHTTGAVSSAGSGDCNVDISLVPRQWNLEDFGGSSGVSSSSLNIDEIRPYLNGFVLWNGILLFLGTVFFMVWTFKRKRI